jgi:hypothetical protein
LPFPPAPIVTEQFPVVSDTFEVYATPPAPPPPDPPPPPPAIARTSAVPEPLTERVPLDKKTWYLYPPLVIVEPPVTENKFPEIAEARIPMIGIELVTY